MAFTIITDQERDSRGATTLPNQPTMPASELKQEFDAPAKEVVVPHFNTLVAELEDQAAASSIGAVAPTGRTGETVQEVIDDISSDLATVESAAVTPTERTEWNSKSTVSFNQVKTAGEKIASITIDGTMTDIYASSGGGGGGGGGAVDSVNHMTGDVILAVEDIDNVNVSSVNDQDVLAYDTTDSEWKNLTLPLSALTGSYGDLINKPTIPEVDQLFDGTSANAQSGVAIQGQLVTKADASDVAEKLTGGLFATKTSSSGANVYFDGVDPTKVYKLFVNYSNSYNGDPVYYTHITITNRGTPSAPNYRIVYTLQNATAGQSFKLFEMDSNSSVLPYYTGSYVTTPRTTSQTLSTANMSMSQNVVVNPISYTETLNAAGGYTAEIGDA